MKKKNKELIVCMYVYVCVCICVCVCVLVCVCVCVGMCVCGKIAKETNDANILFYGWKAKANTNLLINYSERSTGVPIANDWIEGGAERIHGVRSIQNIQQVQSE